MEGWLMRNVLLVIGVLSLGIVPTYAADIGVEAKKLVIVDHLLTDSRVKVTYLSRQKSDVTKGTGTDVNAIDAQVDVSYVNGATSGTFLMPAGAGWIVNIARIARYVNPVAPVGGATQLGQIKPGGKLKLIAQSAGDTPIDILGAGAPGPSGVRVVFTVNNGAETNRHCALFTECAYVLSNLGMEAEMDCRNGLPTPCP
jgi:hypothetical protein